MSAVSRRNSADRSLLGTLSVLAALIVLGSGLAMDRFEKYVNVHLTDSRPINIPLEQMPLDYGDWHGRQEEPDPTIGDLTGMDDVCQIRFHKPGSGWITVLITYSGRPRQLTGHYPDVCYPAAGWHIEYSKKIQLRAQDGKTIPAQLYFMTRFTENMYSQAYVVNTLINNGVVTTDKKSADYRTIGQDRYVAQVQAFFTSADSEAQVIADAENLFGYLLPQLGQQFQGSPLTLVGG